MMRMMKDILATIQSSLRFTGDIFLYWFLLQSNGHLSLVHRRLRVAACAAFECRQSSCASLGQKVSFLCGSPPVDLKHQRQRVEIQFPPPPATPCCPLTVVSIKIGQWRKHQALHPPPPQKRDLDHWVSVSRFLSADR